MSTDLHALTENKNENAGEPVAADQPVVAEASDAAERKPLLVEGREPTAILAAAACAVSLILFGFSGQGVVTAVASATLIVLAAIDIESRILPNRIIFPALAAVLVLRLAFFPGEAVEWLLAGPAAAAFFAAPLIIRRDAMGMGDIKLALLLGAAVGWEVFSAIIIGCLAMVPVAIWMLVRDGSIRNATLPFGPFLAVGTLLILFTA